MKDTTGFGEAKAVKVVGNGEGGPKRVWRPATRFRHRAGAWQRAPGSRSREVDSPYWERRRGREPHRRRAASRSCPSDGTAEARSETRRRSSRANARPWAVSSREGIPTGRSSAEDARVHVARRKGRRRSREARRVATSGCETPKVSATPRRDGPSGTRDGKERELRPPDPKDPRERQSISTDSDTPEGTTGTRTDLGKASAFLFLVLKAASPGHSYS